MLVAPSEIIKDTSLIQVVWIRFFFFLIEIFLYYVVSENRLVSLRTYRIQII